MKLSHKNRARHDRRNARRRVIKQLKELAPQGEVRISKQANVGSRYQGTVAAVLRLAPGINGAEFVELKAKRRKAPLVVPLDDLEAA